PLLQLMMQYGKIVSALPSTETSAKYAREQLRKLYPEHKRFENPHIYKVGISQALMELRDSVIKNV
ncbi:MAG TPA: hypothetical protein PK611_05875, partial [Saprospiraceae bacterium]|nr:hypothetical protein [Saprospiraceae bacterium]